MFEIEYQYVMNEKFFRELAYDKLWRTIIMDIVFILIFTLPYFVSRQYLKTVIIFIIILIALIYFQFISIKKMIKMAKNAAKEITYVKENTVNKEKELIENQETIIKQKITFNEEDILIENLLTNKKISIKCESLNKLYKTKNYYVLYTKAKNILYIPKNSLDEKQEKELIEFLKMKSVKIKF